MSTNHQQPLVPAFAAAAAAIFAAYLLNWLLS
jgi:hypothetical protein